MSSKLMYKIQEVNCAGEITCSFYTSDFYLALADLMLKSRRPLNGAIRRKTLTSNVIAVLRKNDMNTKHPYIIDMAISITEKDTLKDRLLITINTMLAPSDTLDGIGCKSDASYLIPSYYACIQEISEKIKIWSDQNADIAKILAVFSSRDPEHIFWEQQPTKGRVRGYSM